MKKGDVVQVRQGFIDEAYDLDLSGWRGRILEIYEDGAVYIRWDSHTLLHEMPEAVIAACEEERLEWADFVFSPDDVEPAEARDTPADVEEALDELYDRHAWDWLGEDGKLTRQVLAGLDTDDYDAMAAAWKAYMDTHLSVPFDAEVYEHQERGPFRAGDRVRVLAITEADADYGVIVRLRKGRRQYHFPLCDLAALDEDSEDGEIVRQYRIWFANR
jgi:hypothetical protein